MHSHTRTHERTQAHTHTFGQYANKCTRALGHKHKDICAHAHRETSSYPCLYLSTKGVWWTHQGGVVDTLAAANTHTPLSMRRCVGRGCRRAAVWGKATGHQRAKMHTNPHPFHRRSSRAGLWRHSRSFQRRGVEAPARSEDFIALRENFIWRGRARRFRGWSRVYCVEAHCAKARARRGAEPLPPPSRSEGPRPRASGCSLR
jgi:hypothetical protein